MTNWESLTADQKQIIQAAFDLVNGGQDLEEALSCYKTITKYVMNSTYKKPSTTNEV